MKRKIQILGTGRSHTKEMAQRVEKAAKQLGIDYDIEHVTDVRRIMCFAPRLTPALCIDGDIRATGEAPTVKELMGMLNAPVHHRAPSTPARFRNDSGLSERVKPTA